MRTARTLVLGVARVFDAWAASLEPVGSAGLDPVVLPEAPYGIWRFRVLYTRAQEHLGLIQDEPEDEREVAP